MTDKVKLIRNLLKIAQSRQKKVTEKLEERIRISGGRPSFPEANPE
jgi:hypothetical protein